MSNQFRFLASYTQQTDSLRNQVRTKSGLCKTNMVLVVHVTSELLPADGLICSVFPGVYIEQLQVTTTQPMDLRMFRSPSSVVLHQQQYRAAYAAWDGPHNLPGIFKVLFIVVTDEQLPF